MEHNPIESKLIELIIQEKMRKQEWILRLESVDDDLLELLDKINSETAKGFSEG